MTRPDLPATTANDRDCDDFDNFDDFLSTKLSDPTFAAAYEDAAERARIVADLVSCRKAQRLRQRQVADHMGVGQSVVSEFENSGSDAYLSTLQRYARALGARLAIKIELPADQTWAAHACRSYAPRPRGGDASLSSVVVKSPDSPWLAHWATQAVEKVPA